MVLPLRVAAGRVDLFYFGNDETNYNSSKLMPHGTFLYQLCTKWIHVIDYFLHVQIIDFMSFPASFDSFCPASKNQEGKGKNDGQNQK